MKIVFRCDASVQIGTGHVMRCLTLANALAERGAECHFICRKHEGDLLKIIKQQGHQVHELSLECESESQIKNQAELAHAAWLGTTQDHDAALCISILQEQKVDWLIVDHYALDIRWEEKLRLYCKNLMVIDDLADRQHDCDILLDQTFGRTSQEYNHWVPSACKLLCGASYALLRPEFAQWREYSLQRRESGQLEHLLINLGGVDKDNLTTQILKDLQNSELPSACKITVVMGATAPWIDVVREQALLMSWRTEVKTGVSNMAELMANSDLAIGAAGSTSWERCCLGLSTIMLVLADNQKKIALNLKYFNAAHIADNENSYLSLISSFISSPKKLYDMSKSARKVSDGLGVLRVVKHII